MLFYLRRLSPTVPKPVLLLLLSRDDVPDNGICLDRPVLHSSLFHPSLVFPSTVRLRPGPPRGSSRTGGLFCSNLHLPFFTSSRHVDLYRYLLLNFLLHTLQRRCLPRSEGPHTSLLSLSQPSLPFSPLVMFRTHSSPDLLPRSFPTLRRNS